MEEIVLRSSYNKDRENEKLKAMVVNLLKEVNFYKNELELCFEENEKSGVFYPEKAKELGIPEGKMWQELQNGNSVEVNGVKIDSSQVTGDKRPGKKIGISGDTRPTEKLQNFFTNSDYLSFDCTFSFDLKDRAIETNHGTAKEAAELAKNANVKNLILTHFSARYSDESVLLDEAKQIHESVIAAKDLLEIEI